MLRVVSLLAALVLPASAVPSGATADATRGVLASTTLVSPANKFGGDHEAHAPSGLGVVDQATQFTLQDWELAKKPLPGAVVARRMNERFNNEKLEHMSDMVIIHQWDGWEHPDAKWKQCPPANNLTGDLVWSICNRAGEVGPRRQRVSSTIIHAGMRKRISKGDVPLFSYEGGISIKPTKNRVSCAYGVDAGTDDADRGGSNTGSCYPVGGKHGCVPGCGEPPQWCNANNPTLEGGCRCGFDWCSGRPRPWKPSDIGALLKAQMDHGAEYGGLGSLDGYNEIIVDANYREENLPHSIEAFFYVAGCTGAEVMLGHTCEGRAEQSRMHQAFLKEYKLTAEDVPLLRLNPKNWETPFELDDGKDTPVDDTEANGAPAAVPAAPAVPAVPEAPEAATNVPLPDVPDVPAPVPAIPEPAVPEPTEPEPEENFPCVKPEAWCVHAGATNEQKECGGLPGHYCSDVFGKSGFYPCDEKVDATWGEVECVKT